MRLFDATDRRIVDLAVPALASLAIEPVFLLTDTAVVGHLGADSLAGLALASTVMTTVLALCNFLAYATTTRVAYLRGRGEPSGAPAVTAYWVASVLGVVLAVLIFATAGLASRALGGSGPDTDAAVTLSARYLRWAAPGVPGLLVTLAGLGYLRGLDDTRTPMWVVGFTFALNLVLNLTFVLGLEMGLSGAALGTTIAQSVGGLVLMMLCLRRLDVGWRFRMHEARHQARAGVSLVVRVIALIGVLNVLTAIGSRMGAAILAGHQVATRVFFLLTLSLDALAIPASSMVGAALGAGDRAEAERIAGRVVRLGVLSGLALLVLTVVTAPVLPVLFTPDVDVRRVAMWGLVLCGLIQPLAGVAMTLDGVFMGAGEYPYLSRAMAIAALGFAPVGVALWNWHGLGVVGLWAGVAWWMAWRAGLLSTRLRSGRWGRTLAPDPELDTPVTV